MESFDQESWQKRSLRARGRAAARRSFRRPAAHKPGRLVYGPIPEKSGGVSDFNALTPWLERELSLQQQNSSWGMVLIIITGFFCFSSVMHTNVLMAAIWGILLLLALKFDSSMSLQEHLQTALKLASFDHRWVGPLIQALDSPDVRMQGVARCVLTYLLPDLGAREFADLDPNLRLRLYQKLIFPKKREAPLVLALLTALPQIGDAEATSYVERLTEQREWTTYRRRLKMAAQTCLPLLEHRAERLRILAESAATLEALEEDVPDTPKKEAARREVEAHLERLKLEGRSRRDPGMRPFFLAASWLIIVPYTIFLLFSSLVDGDWMLARIAAVLFVLATQLHRFSLSHTQTTAARSLAQYDDIRGVGPLAEALQWPDAETQEMAAEALIRLLPRLTATDTSLLNAKQRASLYSRLRLRHASKYAELQLAILKALEQVGDLTAVPTVQRLAESVPYTVRQRKVRIAARECLPYLRARAQQQQISQTLLRPSAATGAPSEILLRAATAMQETDPQQLLRAGNREDVS